MIEITGLKSLSKFGVDSTRLSTRLPETVNTIKKNAASIGAETAIFRTIVDTSKAASNWQVSIQTAEAWDRKAFYKGSLGSTGKQSKNTALKFAQFQISTARPGQKIYIVNSQDYVADYIIPERTNDLLTRAADRMVTSIHTQLEFLDIL